MTSFTMCILYRLKPLMRQSSMDSYRQRIFSLSFSFRMHIYTILNMHEGRSIVQLKCNLSYALSPTIRHCIKWPTKSMVCVNTRIEKIYNYSHPYATTVHSNVDAPNSIQSQNYHNAIAWVVTIPLNKCRVFSLSHWNYQAVHLILCTKKINVSLVIYHFIWNSEHDR